MATSSEDEQLRSALVAAFAARLRAVRLQRGMSQGELARRAGMHRTQISVLERGRQEPRVGTVARLAAALEVELSELLESLHATDR